MPPVRFETAVSAEDQPQTHALDRAVTGIGTSLLLNAINLLSVYVDLCNDAFFTLLSTVVTLKMALRGPKYDEAVIQYRPLRAFPHRRCICWVHV